MRGNRLRNGDGVAKKFSSYRPCAEATIVLGAMVRLTTELARIGGCWAPSSIFGMHVDFSRAVKGGIS